MDLTTSDIEKDIAGFQQRISTAKSQLAALSTGYLPHPEHKKREKQRRDLQAEIKHVENLVEIARDGIAILKREKGELCERPMTTSY